MSTAVPFSLDPIWSRDEINAWLESLTPSQQEIMKRVGRQWAARGEDLVANYSEVRHAIETGRFHLPANPPGQNVQVQRQERGGFWTNFVKLVNVWRDVQIDNNLRNLGRDLGKINSSIQSLKSN